MSTPNKNTQNNFLEKPRNAIVVVCFIVLALGAAFALSKRAEAQTGGVLTGAAELLIEGVKSLFGGLGGGPFGGKILTVEYCTCSKNGIRVTIGPPKPAVVLFEYTSSKLYREYSIYRPGPWTIGLYKTGGHCEIYSGKFCSELPVQGTITGVGTSM